MVGIGRGQQRERVPLSGRGLGKNYLHYGREDVKGERKA